MKLNPDCIRDILLTIEEVTTPTISLTYQSGVSAGKRLSKYKDDEVAYHMRQCSLSGFLDNYQSFLGGGFDVEGLTPSGHAFIANMRSDTVWQKTKSLAAKIGVGSLDVLRDIAAQVIADLIKGN